MRNLTIKREKSFVASAYRMRVYIEDPASNDLVINGVPCSKLGDLKNGEEKSFIIDNNEAKVFVIGDKLSKGFCNEYYPLPAGEDDIYLTGKNKYNPASGNAFRFDGVTDEEVLKNRKKGTKRGIFVLLIAAIVGAVIGFVSTSGLLNAPAKPETFTYDDMEITLTNEFDEVSVDGYTVCYESMDVGILALEEEFALAEGFGDLSLEEYGQLIIDANALDCSLQDENDLVYFEYQYTDSASSDAYNYFNVVYKTSDAFWMFQFASLEEDYAEYQPLFIEWAQSVEFAD